MQKRSVFVAVAFFLVAAVLGFIIRAHAQQPPVAPLRDGIMARIPEAYRDKARSLTGDDDTQNYLQKCSDDNLVNWLVGSLADKPENIDFLLDRLEKDPSPKIRLAILEWLQDYWLNHPEKQPIVERHATSDPDAGVSLEALEVLRSLRMEALDKLLKQRIAMAKAANDSVALAKFGPAEEQWYSISEQIMLPSFLRVPPPVFAVEPAGKSIRVLAFGDFGTGSIAQSETAAAMVAYHKLHPFDFGLTLGDNFYGYGMVSPSDPRWQTQWEGLYGPLGIKFYATLGNHDWASPDSPAAEILYAQKSPDWRMPAPYYTFTAGAVQFFAFDTVEVNEAELEWLDTELTNSTAIWKVVYGHYHIYSATRGDNKELIERLLPILKKDHVDVYLNGHDHNLQELKPEGGVHFFVSGGGGATLYDLNAYDRSVFKQKVNGFTVLEADAKHLKVSFVGTDGKELYQDTLTKTP